MESVVGRNLKLLRDANGYKQETVAEFLGVNRSAAALFGCELSLLFEEEEKALHGALACAFRADNLSPADMKEVADFKNIVLNYMKMERLLEK